MRRIALLCLLLASCTSARHIREAQDSFSRAAAAENSAISSATTDLVPGGVRGDYRLALAAVDEELNDNEEKLRGEKLLGVALTLKAMCEWRLAYIEGTDAGAMKTTLTRITTEGDAIVLGERDALMVAALPGLRDHDAGVAAPDYARAKPFFVSALAVVKAAADKAPKGHPVGVYLRFAQLSTCRQWQARTAELGVGTAAGNEAKIPRDRGIALLEELQAEAPKNSAVKRRAQEFQGLLGIKEAEFKWE